MRYPATVGWLILNDDKDKPIARFGDTAYALNGTRDPARRPITFALNGGPGSSSIRLHMGVLGPRRVVVNDGGYAPPPTQLVDNEYSILDATDLVMIDPVGTGFSKPLGEAKGTDFWGVDQDIKSVGSFISSTCRTTTSLLAGFTRTGTGSTRNRASVAARRFRWPMRCRTWPSR